MKKSVVLLIHTGYWSLFGLLLLSFFFFAVFVPAHVRFTVTPLNGLLPWIRLMLGFAVLPGLICFYICYTYLFDRFLSRRRFMQFIGVSALTALLSSCIGAALASLPWLFGPSFLFGDGYASTSFILLLMTGLAWINGMIAAVIKGSLTWYREIRIKDELQRKNLQTELALVKSQIDPHFLFNTLNNIDILITHDAATASSYLNKLSGIMRFLLYEAKGERISLERELEYLQQYIELQKIRTSNAKYVDFAVQGPFYSQTIAPMILLPFIENAFKHTESRKAESQIKISLAANNGQLVFTCSNNHFSAEKENPGDGLGNTLIKKRLELLYPDTHTLTITCAAGIYSVKLELAL